MTDSDTVADKLVLLFSADWFRPYWRLTGFVPEADSGDAFQEKMRRVVNDIMADESNYWLIGFSAARLDKTRAALLSALECHKGPDSKLDYLRQLVSSRDHRDALTEISMAFWDNYEATIEELRQADIGSTTWDRRLASLTPGLPSYLHDFVIVRLLATWS